MYIFLSAFENIEKRHVIFWKKYYSRRIQRLYMSCNQSGGVYDCVIDWQSAIRCGS